MMHIVEEGARMAAGPTFPDRSVEEFADWVDPHLLTLNRVAARLVPAADRDDLVQDTLVRAWQRRSTFDPARGDVVVWLLAILRDQGRRRRTRAPAPSVVLETADRGVLDTQRDLDLESAVASLPPRQKLAVDLHYYAGLDVRTCAAVMACSEGTVKATLHQARKNLHRHLDEGGDRDE